MTDASDRVVRSARSVAGVLQQARRSTSIEVLSERMSECRACPRLVSWREEVATTKRLAFADQDYWGRPVPGFGSSHPSLLIIGLAPAAHGANRTGRMFTGDRSGEWLYSALYRAGLANQPHSIDVNDGLELTDTRIISILRCAPPQNKPLAQERTNCQGWLDQEIQLASASVNTILALGGIAWQGTHAALDRLGWTIPRPRSKFGHGQEIMVHNTEGAPVQLIGSYHVSQQNTFTGKLTAHMLDEVMARCLSRMQPGLADAGDA